MSQDALMLPNIMTKKQTLISKSLRIIPSLQSVEGNIRWIVFWLDMKYSRPGSIEAARPARLIMSK